MSGTTLTMILSIGAIHWFAAEALWEKSKTRNLYKEYPIPLGLRLLFAVIIPLFIYGSIDNIRRGGRIWTSALLLAFVLFWTFFTPPKILFSAERIVSIKWYGFKKTTINWRDVIGVFSNPGDNSIVIRDKLDHTIVHTRYNIDRTGFLEQINSLPCHTLSRIVVRL
jgi:hypothetical protein